jgi:hypothetical protein
MAIIEDNPEYQIIETQVPGGITRQVVYKAGTAGANREATLAKARAAFAANQGFLALATPTNAQTLAQVTRLTRQMNAVLRLLLTDFSDVSDT